MPRKGHVQKRDVLADPLYNNKVVTKLINAIMLDGKKGVAQKIVYGAFAKMEEKTGKPAVEVFEGAMNNIMPVLEVKARRIGGATYRSAGSLCSPAREARRKWKISLQASCWMPLTTPAHLSREKKTCTRWQTPTEHFLTTDSDQQPEDTKAAA